MGENYSSVLKFEVTVSSVSDLVHEEVSGLISISFFVVGFMTVGSSCDDLKVFFRVGVLCVEIKLVVWL